MEESDPPEMRDTLREQGEAVVSSVRSAVLHATRHMEALAELFHLELQEYGRAQTRRLTLIAVGSVLLLVAYGFLCMLIVELLACCLKLPWAISIVVFINLVIGLVALYLGVKRKPAGLAPATCRELKDDLQCIKLYLKGKEKS